MKTRVLRVFTPDAPAPTVPGFPPPWRGMCPGCRWPIMLTGRGRVMRHLPRVLLRMRLAGKSAFAEHTLSVTPCPGSGQAPLWVVRTCVACGRSCRDETCLAHSPVEAAA